MNIENFKKTEKQKSKITTIYLRDDIKKDVDKLGVNVSKLVNALLEKFIADQKKQGEK
jgi:post-segregation antitoxin (ccd killing protein)